MKAIILAAGIGSRLRPITSSTPKCLVKVAGKSIIDYQIQSYISAGVEKIIILTGYKSNMVKDFCKNIKGADIQIIENVDYETTNNMYSLYLAREEINGDGFLLSNGDVVFDERIPIELIQSKIDDLIVADYGSYDEESMKIKIDEFGFVEDISKTISPKSSHGNSIDLYKFSSSASKILFEKLRDIIEIECNLNEWTELALQDLLQTGKLKMQPFDITGKKWVEIDNYDDLAIADKLFSNLSRTLKYKKLFFIDLDGTIYNDNIQVKGASDFLNMLNSLNIPYYFLSNNSSRSKNDYINKLSKLGINAKEDDIVLSTDGIIQFLVNKNVENVYVVGTKSMENYISRNGINTNSNMPEYVVLGYDTELTYNKLKHAALHMHNGVELLATHCDVVCPTPNGPIPDIGSILALIEASTGKKPIKIFGKPSIDMVKQIISHHGVDNRDIVVIGDRLYTDMKLARNIGCNFICVLSGETCRDDIENIEDTPELIIDDVNGIIQLIE